MDKRGLFLERMMVAGIKILSASILVIFLSSCGTLVGGKLQTCQKTKPVMDHREIRPWAFAGDVLLAPIALPIDFYTGGIYKPCNKYEVKISKGKGRKLKLARR